MMNTWRRAALEGRAAARRGVAQAPVSPPGEDVVRQLCSMAADYADARGRGKDDAAATWKGMFDMTAESRAPSVGRRALLDDMAAFPECKVPERYLRELGGGAAPLSGSLRPVRVDRAALASLLAAAAARKPGVAGMLDDWNESNRRVRDLLAPPPPGAPAPPPRPPPAPPKPAGGTAESPYFGPERDAILEKMCAIAYAYQRERQAGRSGSDAKEAFAKALGSLKAPETSLTYEAIRMLVEQWCPGVDPGYLWELMGPSIRFLQDQERRARAAAQAQATRTASVVPAPAIPGQLLPAAATAYIPPTAGAPPVLPPRAPMFRAAPSIVPSGFQPSGPASPGTPTPPAAPAPAPTPYKPSLPWVETGYAQAPTGTVLPGFPLPLNIFGGAGGVSAAGFM